MNEGKLIFDPEAICIAKPLFHGSSFFEFSCGKGAFVVGNSGLPRHCPFCHRPVNSRVRERQEDEGEKTP